MDCGTRTHDAKKCKMSTIWYLKDNIIDAVKKENKILIKDTSLASITSLGRK
jgi:hypothetical protein